MTAKVRLSRKKISHGFTLVELIVAIAILALVALATGAVMNQIKDSNEISQRSLQSLRDIQRAMLIIERDFLQMVERAPRTQIESNSLVIMGGDFEFESDEGSAAFVRNGWHNPQMRLPRSSLQRVIYSLQENVLIRQHYNHVDTVIGAEPARRELISGVEDFEVLAAFESRNGELEWEDSYEKDSLPIAVKVTVDSQEFGEIVRLFQVAP